jgi:hypothetical protein
MGKAKRNARTTLEVTIMFEPSRLAAEHLADAYSQLVPLRSRKPMRPKPEGQVQTMPAKVVTRRRA